MSDDRFAAAASQYLTARVRVEEAARRYGVPEKRLREYLRERGQLRKRGQQPTGIDTGTARALRKKQRMSWTEIAAAMGVPRTTVQHSYQREYRDLGTVDLYAHLSGVQAAALGHMWDTMPRHRNGGHDTQCAEARAFLAAARHHRARGVTCQEIGRAAGISGSYLSHLLGR